ncbi:hypothetical protein BH23GEM5_BH23GEM5_08940 [soil metagenome]
MASAAAEQSASELPAGWERLADATDEIVASLAHWRRRALDAEAEVTRLRQAMNDMLLAPADGEIGPVDELKRLRAENALYLSRIVEARKRVSTLLTRVAALEEDR